MSGASSSFLTKSIILLALVLVSMGGSMFVGKELGKNIMSLTRSNIEERYPEVITSDEQSRTSFLVGLGDERSSFGYDQSQFGSNQFPREWADPPSEQISVVGEEAVVDITVHAPSEDTGQGQNLLDETNEETSENSESQVVRQSDRTNLFSLGADKTFRIQVGTFGERANAESVWRDLTQAGYNASISTYNDEETVRYRVQVGTYTNRDEADKVAEQIRSMGFDAWVYQVQ